MKLPAKNPYPIPYGVLMLIIVQNRVCLPGWLIKSPYPYQSTIVNCFLGRVCPVATRQPGALNFAGSKNGTSYLDDFENSQSVIDRYKSANTWQISGTPQMFKEEAGLMT
jgi:hypothetical protein